MEPKTIQYQPEICKKHERHFEELWKGEFECLGCFEDYHQHMISALEHEDEFYDEGRVD